MEPILPNSNIRGIVWSPIDGSLLGSLRAGFHLILCIPYHTDPSILGKMVLEGAETPMEDLGMPSRLEQRWEGGAGGGQIVGFSLQEEPEAHVFCGGDRTQSPYTVCGSWSMPTQHGIERGAGSMPPIWEVK